MRAFAQRLIAYETGGNRPSGAAPRVAFPVPEKLRLPLATMMGNGGFRALLARALALASAEVPWLQAVHVKAGGTLGGFEELHPELAPADYLEGRVVLLAQLLGLLVTFIGPGLTVQLVGEIWPQILPGDLDLGNRDKNEKSK
jgi:hypothetical protein